MLQLRATRRTVDLKALALQPVSDAHWSRLVSEPATIIDAATGRAVLLYVGCPAGMDRVAAALPVIRYVNDYRTSGLPTNSRVFGFEPRKTLRKDFCSATSLAYDMPEQHAVLADFAEYIGELYRRWLPELWEHHVRTMRGVLPDYHLPGGMFTSGIVNKNNALRYHWDRGNHPDLWSAMVMVRDDADAGYLVLPEYELALDCAHGMAVLFPGQRILHGVNAIHRTRVGSARYSVVYYALQGMWNCKPIATELARIRAVKTQRERRRATLGKEK